MWSVENEGKSVGFDVWNGVKVALQGVLKFRSIMELVESIWIILVPLFMMSRNLILSSHGIFY